MSRSALVALIVLSPTAPGQPSQYAPGKTTPPDAATLGKVKVFRTLNGDEETKYSQQFQSAIGN